MVTSIVTEREEVVVTATPAPVEEAAAAGADDPTTLVEMAFGDINTLDPALAYDTASSDPLQHIYESLIWYDHRDGANFVPALAVEVPTVENGGISEDGLTYTFHIREGVTFHEGQTLEPSDVAYSFQRGLLQSNLNGPQWLLIEPILGYTSGDVVEGIQDNAFSQDPEGLRAGATAEELVATCELVKSHVVADDDAGTVTFTLATPWGPFLATLAPTWGGVIDYDWAVAQGDWDGDCGTWQDFYAIGPENTKLGSITNGTGPFILDHWTPGEEWVMVANENYWRTEDTPIWEGGPYGPPALKTIIVQIVSEWGTRFAALQAGDVAWVAVNASDETQVDPLVGEYCDWETGDCTVNEANPDGPLRKWDLLPSTGRTDLFLTWNVADGSPYIGSGKLDGNGIPQNFFSDINVRRAMASCFDYDTYIDEAMNGKGVRNNGPIIMGMLGYNEDGLYHQYDPEACAAYLAEAWDGVLPETGFRFQAAFNTGNTGRQIIGEILQAELGAINPLYQVETIGLPWPTMLRQFQAAQLPVVASGWIQDIHDPHNWVVPFTYGTYGGRQGLPDDIKAKYQEMATAAVQASDPAVREQIYFDLQKEFYEDIVSVTLAQQTGFRFEQRWLDGFYFRVGQFGAFRYGMSQD